MPRIHIKHIHVYIHVQVHIHYIHICVYVCAWWLTLVILAPERWKSTDSGVHWTATLPTSQVLGQDNLSTNEGWEQMPEERHLRVSSTYMCAHVLSACAFAYRWTHTHTGANLKDILWLKLENFDNNSRL